MSLGKGAVASYSWKHKINTRSFTKSKIVSVDQLMPTVCWTYNFLEAQGYLIEHLEIFQFNISAQLLEVNGKLSSSKKTKHTKAKFFFMKDKVGGRSVKTFDCPTEYMWAYVNIKPVQGTLFKVMRDKLMNCGVDYNNSFLRKQGEKAPASIVNQSIRSARNPTKRTVLFTQECVVQARFGKHIVGGYDGKARIVRHENNTGRITDSGRTNAWLQQ